MIVLQRSFWREREREGERERERERERARERAMAYLEEQECVVADIDSTRLWHFDGAQKLKRHKIK